MTYSDDEERTLIEWSMRITQALQLLDLKMDQKKILEVAEKSSQSVTKSAGPISTFAMGYAAGLAARNGRKSGAEAARSAADVVLDLADGGAVGGPDRDGWTGTAQ